MADEAQPDDRHLLQDWVPLGRSLQGMLSQVVWTTQGASLFVDQQVPTVAHDSGTVSAHHAQLLARWCAQQSAAGALPARIVVVEAAIGTGVQLRLLLDAFRSLCAAAGRDWYGRLAVFATDVNEATVRRTVELGLYAPHAALVRVGWMDVTRPGLFLELDTGAEVDLRGRIHLLLAHYVLDLMPADVLRRVRANDGTPQWQALLARTWLRQSGLLPRYTDADVEGLLAAANAGTVAALQQLAPVHKLLQTEVATWSVDLASHPEAQWLEREANAQEAALGEAHPLLAEGTVVNHAATALAVLRSVVAALAPDGYAVVRDIGFTTAEMAAEIRGMAHYGATRSMGVNFVALDRWFADHPEDGALTAPGGEAGSQHATRLLTRSPNPALAADFVEAFAPARLLAARLLATEARAASSAGEAMERYRQAAVLEPDDWFLLLEAARLAVDQSNAGELALALSAKALTLNPWSSPELWRVHGDARRALDQPREAAAAYRRGLQVAPRDPGLHWSLGRLATESGRFEEAFRHIGEALACDSAAVWREEALQLLDAALRRHAQVLELERQLAATRLG
jgi:tetratricopeptide (TPR) repeat protein